MYDLVIQIIFVWDLHIKLMVSVIFYFVLLLSISLNIFITSDVARELYQSRK